MDYTIEIVSQALEELKNIKRDDRVRILDEIECQLPHEPNVQTRNRKLLDIMVAGLDFSPPLWELRVGEYRVFYDTDESERSVIIRAVRVKKPDQTTEAVIQ